MRFWFEDLMLSTCCSAVFVVLRILNYIVGYRESSESSTRPDEPFDYIFFSIKKSNKWNNRLTIIAVYTTSCFVSA